jgi:glucokinase
VPSLGVDLGGTKILAQIYDTQSSETTALYSREYSTDISGGSDGLLKQLAMVITEARRTGFEIGSIGLATAGMVDVTTKSIVYASDNLPGWTGTFVEKRLQELMPDLPPFTIENDANAAVYGEWILRDRPKSLGMLTLGTGVGGGVIVDGQILRGDFFAGGELGHIVIVDNGRLCTCGLKGCLEAYISGTALGAIASERFESPVSSRDLFDYLSQGINHQRHKESLDIITESTNILAKGLTLLETIFNPTYWVLGGGMASQPIFFGILKQQLAQHFLPGGKPFPVDRLVLALSKNEAGALGASYLSI